MRTTDKNDVFKKTRGKQQIHMDSYANTLSASCIKI